MASPVVQAGKVLNRLSAKTRSPVAPLPVVGFVSFMMTCLPHWDNVSDQSCRASA
jgi:hypothetical protein